MTTTTTITCSCAGANPNCFKCDGAGFITSAPSPAPGKFFVRGIAHDGTLSPDELHEKQIRARKEAANKKAREAKSFESAQKTDVRQSVPSHNQTAPPPTKNQARFSYTTYRCISCSYKWNRSSELRCAWCNELGPYELNTN
jgi:hypothetical protein